MIRRTLWAIAHSLYVHAAKPILFRFTPDKVHDQMIRFSVVVQNTPILRGFTRLVFVKQRNELVQTIHGVEFLNPVGIAAGFDKNAELIPVMAALGFGFVEVGSVTADPCAGNPKPWYYRLPKTKSVVVNAGLANQGSTVIIDRIKSIKRKLIDRFPVVLSVAKTNSCDVVSEADGINDYVTSIKRAKKVNNIKMIEINISCPNTYGGEPFTSPDKLERLLTAVDEIDIKKPIFIKMPINLPWSKFKQLLDVAVAHNLAGVTISNLSKDRSKVELLDDLPDEVQGSFSGRPTFIQSNELIKRTYLEYGDKLTIIGVGGIFSAHDAYEKIRLGASLVELITGMLFNGPQLAAQINVGLYDLLKKDGFTHISEAIGIDANK